MQDISGKGASRLGVEYVTGCFPFTAFRHSGTQTPRIVPLLRLAAPEGPDVRSLCPGTRDEWEGVVCEREMGKDMRGR